MIVGDLNKHLADAIIVENKKITYGGKLLKEFLSEDKYILVNATDKTVGGPFTRIDPSDPENDSKKAALDLIIISKGLNERRIL